MPSVIFEFSQGATNTTISTGFTYFSMTKVSGDFPSTPYRITGAQLLFSHIRIDAQLRGMQAYCNSPGVEAEVVTTSAFRNYGLMAEGNYYDVVFECSTAVNYAALNNINLRSVKASSSTDGAVCSVRAQSVIRLTVTYELTTTACTPLTALSLSSTLSEGDVTLTGSGAGGGVGNSITGYEIQYRDSLDGASYGGWTAHTTAVTNAGSFAISVPPPTARGYYRQYRARTVGSAGAEHASGWKESSNAVRRYTHSAVSLNKSTLDAGGTITATITPIPMAANLTHKVTWRFGARTDASELAVGVTSKAFTIPEAWLDVIPKAESGSATCEVETLLNGASLGNASASFIITCPAGVVPTIGSMTVVPVSDTVPAAWGLYLKGQSKVAVTMTGVAAGTGSTITSQTIGCDDYSGNGSTLTTGIINRVGDVKFTGTVTDARGKTTTKTVTATFTDYTTPRIASLTAFRANAQGVADNNGTCIAGNVEYNYAKVGGNAAKLWVYIGNTVVVNGAALNAASAKYSYSHIGSYAIASSHTVRVEIRDTVNAVAATAEAVVSTVARIMNIGSGTDAGVAFGKMSEMKKALEIAADWKLLVGGMDATKPFSMTTAGDNRKINQAPNDYNNQLKFSGLKENSVIGMTAANSTYSYVLGLRGWTDSSGGDAHELAFNNGGIFDRKGSTTSFGSWDQLITKGMLLNLVYPVGSLHLSVTATNPGTIFGGTWVAFGQGRVLMGVGSNGATNYGSADITGGSETHTHSIASHTHGTSAVTLTTAQIPAHSHTFANGQPYVLDSDQFGSGSYLNLSTGGGKGWRTTTAPIANAGSGGSHTHGATDGAVLTPSTGDSRQPYITCYMWKRTA